MHTFEMTRGQNKGIRPNRQGPVAGLVQAATLIGGELRTDNEGFVINLCNENMPDLHLNKGKDKKWKSSLATAITSAITMQLRERTYCKETEEEEDEKVCAPAALSTVVEPQPSPSEENPGHRDTPTLATQPTPRSQKNRKRQDLYGVGNLIDVFATTALL